MSQVNSEAKRAGYHLKPWCKSTGICPATFYNLPDEQRPQSVLIARRRIIIESPEAYLQRMASREVA